MLRARVSMQVRLLVLSAAARSLWDAGFLVDLDMARSEGVPDRLVWLVQQYCRYALLST